MIRNDEHTNEYTLSAFMVNVQMENWIPTYGDVLTCCIVDDEVQVLYSRDVVGKIPRPLMATFGNFLQCGTIHAKVAGALINQGYGDKIPVDYIFASSIENIKLMISEIEVPADENSTR